jgi:hypothetical protein
MRSLDIPRDSLFRKEAELIQQTGMATFLQGRGPHSLSVAAFGFWFARRTLRWIEVTAITALFVAPMVAPAAPAMAQSAALQAGAPVNVVELVNFACLHCRAESQYVPQIAAAVRAQGGVFRIAPIGPQNRTLPAPTVLVYYAAASAEHNDPTKTHAIAQAFYDGYKAQADLTNDHAVLSWLQTQIPAIPYRDIRRQLATAHPERRFDKAAWLAIKTSASVLPAFIYISAATGSIVWIDQWQGKASDLTKRVLDHLGAN